MVNGSISFVSVGDIVMRRGLFRKSVSRSNGFSEILDILSQADFSFGDLETPFSQRGFPIEKLINFRADPIIAEDLQRAGFKVLCLANNHCMDYGQDALFDTMVVLDKLGIHHLGAGKNLAEATKPLILGCRGLRLGLLAFSCLLPTGSAASSCRPGFSPIHVHTAYEVNAFSEMEEPGTPPIVRSWADAADLASAVANIRDLREKVDFLIVTIHWGYGAGEKLAEYQQSLAHALVDAGSDVILGHHVHATQGIEVYRSKMILYSPGNFIAQQHHYEIPKQALDVVLEMSKDGYIARLVIGVGGKYRVNLIPIVANDDGVPEVSHGTAFQRCAERLERLSMQMGTNLRINGEEIEVLL